MKLENKKALASRALNIARTRIIFNAKRLSEIKEAITKQDIKDLKETGAISIREEKGRRKVQKRKIRRMAGSIRKSVKNGKRSYVVLTRKLRKYLRHLKARNQISPTEVTQLRKLIRASEFRSLSHMKERINQLKEEK